MKLIFKGKYNGVVETFPSSEKIKKATKYKEAENTEEMARILRTPQNIIFCILLIVVSIMSFEYIPNFLILILNYVLSYIISLIFLIPHELLHAICFKKRVYLYYNTKPLMMFVIGEDHMSKLHFIFMSLLPNIILGFIPFIIFLFNPFFVSLGLVGVFNIVAGIGDYYNVYNTIKQVPKGAKIFMKYENTYWYIPKSVD